MIRNLRINLKSESQFVGENQKIANHFSLPKFNPVHTYLLEKNSKQIFLAKRFPHRLSSLYLFDSSSLERAMYN